MNAVAVCSNNEEKLNSFLIYLKNTKNASANTLAAYRRDLLKLISYLDSFGFDVSIVDESTLCCFVDSLFASGISEASLCRIISSIRSFYKFLVSEALVSENPSKGLSHKKSDDDTEIETLTSDEIVKLLSQPNTTDLKQIRDKAMLEVLYSTGLKVSELVSLNLTDVNLKLGYIHCKGDGGRKKDRDIVLYPIAVRCLSLYITKSRPVLISLSDETEALFINTNGTRLTRQGFWKILKGYAKDAGIDKHITPIILRHSFAMHLIENGADINDIKEILGHTCISSTLVYENQLKKKLSTSLLKFHPRA